MSLSLCTVFAESPFISGMIVALLFFLTYCTNAWAAWSCNVLFPSQYPSLFIDIFLICLNTDVTLITVETHPVEQALWLKLLYWNAILIRNQGPWVSSALYTVHVTEHGRMVSVMHYTRLKLSWIHFMSYIIEKDLWGRSRSSHANPSHNTTSTVFHRWARMFLSLFVIRWWCFLWPTHSVSVALSFSGHSK